MKRAVLLFTLLASAICISHADTQQVVDCGKQIEVSATPSNGYHFIRWHDGVTDNPRLVTPTSDMEFTAVFEKDGDVPCPTTYGSVSATAEGSYVWFGETYTQSGQYQHTIKNVAGCDSVITLDLTITNNPSASQQVVDCGKEIEISAIPSDGYHFVQWQDGNKDNPRTVTPTSDMEFTAVFEKDTDVPCQTTYGSVSATAEDSYVWFGKTYTKSGTYQHTIQNVAGCDSIITLNLTITSVVEPCQTTYGSVSATAEGSYAWFGKTYTKSGTYQYTIQNVAGCDSIITLDLTITNTQTEMQQVVDCGKEIEISAIPSDGYHFVQWQDGNKDNPRTVTPTSNMEFTAIFEKDTDVPCQTTYGSVNATAEGSYVWFGDTYTQSGQYQHTIQNKAGCDSIITLNLTITKPDVPCQTTYGSISATAEGSYVWFGETYIQSGQYQHTIQNIAGCDSIITLNLTITKPDVPCQTTYGTVNASAEGSYVWFGETYTQSGQYQHTIQNVAGCDSIITLNLTITKPDVPCKTTYGTVNATAEGSYFWFGETYTQSGQYQYTIQNTAGCDSIITLNLTITKPDVPCQTTYGSISATAEGSYVWFGDTYTQSGQYQHTIQNVAGCDSIITLNLTITKSDVPCQTTYGSISATAEGSYVWFGDTYTQSGQYQHTIQNVAGCDSIITLNLTITKPDVPCQTTYGTVTASAEGSYVCFGETYTQSGQYQHTIQNVAGCDSIITLNLTITKPDVPCKTTYGTVNATAEGSYFWFGETYTQSGQYQHTIQNVAGCDSVITLNLTITKPDVPCQTTYGSISATAEGSYFWFGETYTQSGQYQHTIQNVAGCDSVITLNLTITSVVEPCKTTYGTVTATAEGSYVWYGETYTQSGQYQHTIQNVAGCDSVITLNLTITKPDVPCQTTYGSVSATAEGSYVWFGETYTQSGQYQHTIQNVAGCDSVITLNLIITKPDVPCQTTYGTVSATAEGSYVWFGETYTQSGQYQHSIQNVAGCDSIITLQLTIYNDTIQPVCRTYTLTLRSDNTAHGTTNIIQEPDCETNQNTAIFEAVAADNYMFDQWSDGNKDNPRTLRLASNLTLYANFNLRQYSLQATSEDYDKGMVTGSGYYIYNTSVIITAVPSPGYAFSQWSDGNTDNPRTIIVNEDITLQAVFTEQYYNIYVSANDAEMGAVSGSGQYQAYTFATIKAEAFDGFTFVSWSDGNKQAERQVLVLSDMSYQAVFIKASTYHIEAISSNEAMGTVEGGGYYAAGTEVMLTAVAKQGYHFTHWQDDVTDNPRSVIVRRDATYYAYFWLGTDLETNSLTDISISDMQIKIDGHEGERFGIWSVTGQMIYDGTVQPVITLPYHGVFIIRLGERMAKIVL